ncbi:B9 domain-containing protein 1, variant 3 [Schistosoma haematobium]|uniref:B9 domain-containing protein 1, variant 3 n=1 Tax=Schistosoma haematobium TaxID=6185 RepID=A0A922LPC5_SCHHA|nr:B9 domain-containing protein 1, variant 3 [Schistosoma haematobium]KAH9590888.1 B9 domain-containing protein 1, variant 3 [Schistosoma haematobium]
MCKGKGCMIAAYIFFAVSLLLFTGCVIVHFYVDQAFMSIMKKFMLLTPGSIVFEAYSNDDTAIITRLYAFNLLNEEEVLKGGKPLFEEVGPYIYWKKINRWDFTFSNETPPKYLRHKKRTYYYPHENLSRSDIHSRQITSLDLFAGGIILQEKSVFTESYYRTTKPFVTKTPNEILWGYTHENIESCYKFGKCPKKISVFVKENGTSTEEFLLKTGVDDINERGKVEEFQGEKELNVWKSKYANMINGSEGAFIGFDLSVGARRHVFVPGICRSVIMEAKKLVPHPKFSKLQVLLFAPVEVEENSSIYPSPSEFCQGQPYEPKCAPEGFVSFSPCLESDNYMPLYGSQGHFAGADPKIRNQFGGISEPDEVDDNTVLYVDPVTGLALGAHQSMQINFYIDNEKRSSMPFKMMRGPYFFPIIRIVNEIYPPVETLETLFQKVQGNKKLLNWAVYILGGVCLLVILLTSMIIVRIARELLE